MNRRTLVRMIGGAAAVPVLAGCTVLDALDEDRELVQITGDSTFQPGGITVKIGETIVWRSMDAAPHILSTDPAEFEEDIPVQVPDGAQPFTSPELLLNEMFTYQFEVPGEYIYACTIHPHMIGTVTVTE